MDNAAVARPTVNILFRQLLQRSPTLRSGAEMAQSRLNRRALSQLSQVDVFVPNSRGSPNQLLHLALTDANRSFPMLAQLIEALGTPPLAVVDAQDFPADDREKRAAADLKVLLDRYGSDKATDLACHHVYGSILSRIGSVKAILEIGLGTNNPDVVSHMGIEGSPGASLRAFRDFCPDALVYGADIDKRILFTEDRIETFFVDQLDFGSFDALSGGIARPLDLVIDDGLHSPSANFSVLLFALQHLQPGGWAVIEDIACEAISVWQVVAALLGPAYACHIVDVKSHLMFVAQKQV